MCVPDVLRNIKLNIYDIFIHFCVVQSPKQNGIYIELFVVVVVAKKRKSFAFMQYTIIILHFKALSKK